MFAAAAGFSGPLGLSGLESDPAVASMSKNDFLVILGDSGVFAPRADLRRIAEEYRSLPCSVLFLDGPGDDYDLIGDYPPFPWNGGTVHTVSRGLIHLTRGQVFRLGGKTVLTMGGKTVPGRTDAGRYWDWWPEQDSSQEDADTACGNVRKAGGKADIVLTCDCPRSWKRYASGSDVPQSAEVLESVLRRIGYGHWYFAGDGSGEEFPEVRATAVFRRIIPFA